MNNIITHYDDIVIGVDTHKDIHVGVALDGLGRRLSDITVKANPEGYGELLLWAQKLGVIKGFGVEGCGSYGHGLSQYLKREGQVVREVSRPPRRGERRLVGKSDLIDAEHGARELLAGRASAIPKDADGKIEAIRIIKIAKDTAVKSKSQVMIALKTLIVTSEDDLRRILEPMSDHKLIKAITSLDDSDQLAISTASKAMIQVLNLMGQRWLYLHEEIKIHVKALEQLTKDIAPDLVDAVGIGADSAAALLCAFGDNINRIKSEEAFAKMCGVCPIPASSGRTDKHRLNRGGNRAANSTLYRIAIVRMAWHKPTIEYVKRRTNEGLSKKDIIRCLKRYIAREAYKIITSSLVENMDETTLKKVS